MLRFEFEVDGAKQVSRGLTRFEHNVEDLTPAFEQIARDFHNIVEAAQFRAGGRGDSGAWAPLSPRTAARKRGPQILVESGLLRDSLTGKGNGSVEEISPRQLKLGTRVPHAILHQRGTSRMPARPPIDLNEGDRRRWVKHIQRHLVESAERAF